MAAVVFQLGNSLQNINWGNQLPEISTKRNGMTMYLYYISSWAHNFSSFLIFMVLFELKKFVGKMSFNRYNKKEL